MTKQSSSNTSSQQNGRLPTSVPDPEVVPRATRRQFNAAYKRQIVAKADTCTERLLTPGAYHRQRSPASGGT
jgi:hypothetical protein